MSNYQATFNQDPAALVLDVHNLEDGTYLLEGDVSAQRWQQLCEKMHFVPGGHAHCSLTLSKKARKFLVEGNLQVTLKRECTRTLEIFEEKLDIHICEHMATERHSKDSPDLLLLEEGVFDGADFISQMVILNASPYPVHPDTLSVSRGEYNLHDGVEEQASEDDNPFAVLKQMKK